MLRHVDWYTVTFEVSNTLNILGQATQGTEKKAPRSFKTPVNIYKFHAVISQETSMFISATVRPVSHAVFIVILYLTPLSVPQLIQRRW